MEQIEQLKAAAREKYAHKAKRLMDVQATISNYRLSPEDLDEIVTSTYLQAVEATSNCPHCLVELKDEKQKG